MAAPEPFRTETVRSERFRCEVSQAAARLLKAHDLRPMDPTDTLPLDAETKALEAPHGHKDELRLWLRLLTCTTLVETEIRRRLREQFDVTLPRFDLMAQLERAPQGMTLGEMSKRMMVSNGNVTGLVDRLVESGHLERTPLPTDRRVQVVKLTKAGRSAFAVMARAHEDWIAELFGDLSARDIEALLKSLGKLKTSVSGSLREGGRE
jgi:DNA-binding MarR family transcriptional regulator